MILLKSQKNILFDIIVQNDISPSYFILKESKKNGSTSINFINSMYFFSITASLDKITVRYTPGQENPIYSLTTKRSFESILNLFEAWLVYLKPEIIQPDKWADFFNSVHSMNFNFNEDDENNNFTYSEVLEIQKSIERIKLDIKNLSLTENQINIVTSKLDYLCEKSKVLNKIDWKNIMIGTLINIPIQLAISPEVSKSFFEICKIAFNKIFLLSF